MIARNGRLARASSGVPSFVAIVDRSEAIAGWAGGAVAVLLLCGGLASQGGATGDWLAVAAVAITWLAGMRLPRRRRGWVVVGAMLLAPLLAGLGLVSASWMPVPQLMFAVVVTAAFVLPLTGAVGACVLGAALQSALSWPAGPQGGVYTLVVGIGYAVAVHAWRRFAAVEDDVVRVLQSEWQHSREEEQFAEGRFLVQRRLHETILNTLSGISAGVRPDRIEVAREAARSDLLQLELGTRSLGDCSATAALEDAVGCMRSEGLEVEVRVVDDIELEGSSATALRDAVVEALRNVSRHAGVRRAAVTAASDSGWLVVRVRDHGVGLGPGARERFGIRHTIRGSMEVLGGEGSVETAAGGGTEVTLRIPPRRPLAQPVAGTRPLGVFDSSLLARFGVISPVLCLLLWGVNPFLFFALPVLVLVTSCACAAASIALCLAWDGRWRVTCALLVVLTTLMTYGVVASTGLGCESMPGVVWLLATISGGVVLPVFAPASLGARLAMVLVTSLGLLMPVLSVPSACRLELVPPVAVHAAYVGLVTAVVAWLGAVYAPRRDRQLQDWLDGASQHSARLARVRIEEEWIRQGGSARRILDGIASGTLDVQDEGVRAWAEAEARELRSRLAENDHRADDSGLVATLDELREFALTVGAVADVAVLCDAVRPDALPPDLVDIIRSGIRECGRRTVWARGLVDSGQEEVVVRIPVECAVAAGIRDGYRMSADAMLVMVTERSAEEGEETRFVMSLRRPTEAPATE